MRVWATRTTKDGSTLEPDLINRIYASSTIRAQIASATLLQVSSKNPEQVASLFVAAPDSAAERIIRGVISTQATIKPQVSTKSDTPPHPLCR